METSEGFTMSLQQQIDVNYKHEVCEVCELAAKNGLDACFIEVKRDGPIHNAIFTYRLTVGRLTSEAQGPTKTIAKTLAAKQILPDLRQMPLSEKRQNGFTSKNKKLWRKLPAFQPTANPIAFLHEIVTKCRGKPTEYTVDHVDREFDPWVFYVRVTVTDKTAIGAGHSKKEAKRNAAAKVLNTIGYSFLYFEPENTKQELLAVTQVSTAPQDALSEEAAPGEDRLEVTHQDPCPVTEGNGSQHEKCLPENVQPDLAGMGLTEDINTSVQWSGQAFRQDEPMASRDLGNIIIPEDLPAPDIVLDSTFTPESDVSTPEEVVHLEDSMLVELVPQEETEASFPSVLQVSLDLCDDNGLEHSPKETVTAGNKQSSTTIQEAATSQVETFDEPGVELNAQLALELQKLLADVQPLLDFMEVETNAISEGSQDVCSVDKTPLEEGKSEASPPMADTTNVNTIPQDSYPEKRSAVKRTLLTVVISMASADPVGESSIPIPEGGDPPTSSNGCPESCISTKAHQLPDPVGEGSIPVPEGSDPPTSSGRPVCYVLFHELVKKVLKMAGSHKRQDSDHMAIKLNEKVENQLIVNRECDISFEDLQKIAKRAAKRLVLEHGSACTVLKAAAADPVAFEGDVVRHLNIELGAFLNRPKSISDRFFSRLGKAFCFC